VWFVHEGPEPERLIDAQPDDAARIAAAEASGLAESPGSGLQPAEGNTTEG
jgi:1,4-alpha-glucan branching enzyme